MADIAEFGVVVKKVEGADQAEAAFRKIEAASEKSTAAVNRHAGAFENMARKTAGANNLSATVASQLQAAGVRYDAVSRTFHSATTTITAGLNGAAAASAKASTAFTGAGGGIFAMGEAARKAPGGIVALGNALDKTKENAKKAAYEMTALDRALLSSTGRAGNFATNLGLLASPIGVVTAAIAAAVAILAVFAAGIYAAKKAWDFFTDSLSAAGKVQNAQTSLKLMIGNAVEAEKVFKQLNQIELDTGIFDETALNRAATQLWAVGIGLNDLVPKVKELGNVAAILNTPIESSVSSYVRLISMLGATGKIQSRTLMQFAQQGFDILALLRQATGKSEEQVRQMVETHQIGLKEIDTALAELAKKDFMGARAREWEGLWKRLKAGWSELHEVFGMPIIDALSPIFERMLTGLPFLINKFQQWGEEVAHVIRAFELLGKERGWATALEAAWSITVIKMTDFLVTTIVNAFVKLGPAAASAFWEGFKENLKQKAVDKLVDVIPIPFVGDFLADALKDAAGIDSKTGAVARVVGKTIIAGIMGGALEDIAGFEKIILDALKRTESQSGDLARGAARGTLGGVDNTRYKSNLPSAGDLGGSDLEKYQSDLKIINDYWKEYALIQGTAATATEYTRRMIELQTKTAAELVDPEKYAQVFDTIEGKWAAMENARLRKAEEIDKKIIMGTATVAESMARGFEKAMESWGNFQTKVSKFAEDALNRIGDGFADAFGDLITGTKSASEAFRDMAVSILEDISRMIIKMLVLQAIQYAMGMFGGGGGTISGSAGVGASGGIGAKGGAIFGPSHAGGGVPIEAEGGEFMLRKDAVRNQRMEDLYALNEGRATIRKKYPGGGPVLPGSGGPPEPPYLFGYQDAGYSGGVYAHPNTGTFDRGSHIYRNFNNPPAGGGSASAGGGYSGGGSAEGGLQGWYQDPMTGRWTRFDPGFGQVPPSAEVTPGQGSGHGMIPGGINWYNSIPNGRGGYEPNLGQYQHLFAGTPSLFPTTWSWQGSMGWVPRAQLANPSGVAGGGAPRVNMGNIGYTGTGSGGGSSAAWYQRGYVLPQGIRDAIARGDYSGAYGQGGNQPRSSGYSGSGSSFSSDMAPFWSQGSASIPGPLRQSAGDSGRDWFGSPAHGSGYIDVDTGLLTRRPGGVLANNPWTDAGRTPGFHSGGIVGLEGTSQYMAMGGQVGDRSIMAKDGEGVFTRGQMAALGAGMSGGGSSVTVIVNVDSHDNIESQTETSTGGGLSESDAKRMAEAMANIAKAEIRKSKRYRGQLYVSRTGASR